AWAVPAASTAGIDELRAEALAMPPAVVVRRADGRRDAPARRARNGGEALGTVERLAPDVGVRARQVDARRVGRRGVDLDDVRVRARSGIGCGRAEETAGAVEREAVDAGVLH